MVDVSLHGVQDVSAFQWVGSESETICLGIPGAEEQSESPHRLLTCKTGKKAQGSWTETCCSNASSNGAVRAALKAPLEPDWHLGSWQAKATRQVTATVQASCEQHAEWMAKSSQAER